jgi:hypothetical protein
MTTLSDKLQRTSTQSVRTERTATGGSARPPSFSSWGSFQEGLTPENSGPDSPVFSNNQPLIDITDDVSHRQTVASKLTEGSCGQTLVSGLSASRTADSG